MELIALDSANVCSFQLPETEESAGPAERRQAQVDGSRVERVNRARRVQLQIQILTALVSTGLFDRLFLNSAKMRQSWP